MVWPVSSAPATRPGRCRASCDSTRRRPTEGPAESNPAGRLVSSKRRTSGLDFFRVRGQARGDAERRMDERDLDVPVTVGSPLDQRQGGQDPFGVGEVLSRGAGWLWCAVHGPDLNSGQGPGPGRAGPPGAAKWLRLLSVYRKPRRSSNSSARSSQRTTSDQNDGDGCAASSSCTASRAPIRSRVCRRGFAPTVSIHSAARARWLDARAGGAPWAGLLTGAIIRLRLSGAPGGNTDSNCPTTPDDHRACGTRGDPQRRPRRSITPSRKNQPGASTRPSTR